MRRFNSSQEAEDYVDKFYKTGKATVLVDNHTYLVKLEFVEKLKILLESRCLFEIEGKEGIIEAYIIRLSPNETYINLATNRHEYSLWWEDISKIKLLDVLHSDD